MMKTKAIYCLIFFLSIVLISNGQSYNFIQRSYINTVSNDTIIETYWSKLPRESTFVLNFRFVKINSTYFLELKFSFGDFPQFSISKNDSVWIKFNDGSSSVLYAEKAVKSRRGMCTTSSFQKGLTTFGIDSKYVLPIQDLKKIQTLSLDKFRIFSSRGYDNLLIDKSDGNMMMEYAKYIEQKQKHFRKVSGNQDPEVPADQKKEEW